MIWIPLQRRGGRSLLQQIHAALRDAVLQGRLAPGSRLPATRTLAAELGVSRNTVLQVFEQLVAEGILVSVRGAGTFVARSLPGRLQPRPERAVAGALVEGLALARCGRAVQELRPWLLSVPARRPFELGLPEVRSFPRAVWVRLTNRLLRQDPALLQYGEVQGHAGLRSALADYLRTARGVLCEPDEILVVNGSQQALDLVARVLLDPGDEAWIEDPGYFGARWPLEAAGARLVPVPVDAEGIRLSAVEGSPAPRLIYVTPSSHFPLGVPLGMARRHELLALARERGCWIVEDDYDSEFRYAGPPLPALRSLAGDGRVLYIGTFSKTLAPGLRAGYLVLPRELVPVFANLRFIAGQHSPTLEQAVLAEFLREGHFATHVARMRRLYRERRDVLLEELRERLPAGFEPSAPDGGMHLLLRLPGDMDDQELVRRADARGLSLTALRTFCLRPRPDRALLLGFAAYDDGELREGVRRLCELLCEARS